MCKGRKLRFSLATPNTRRFHFSAHAPRLLCTRAGTVVFKFVGGGVSLPPKDAFVSPPHSPTIQHLPPHVKPRQTTQCTLSRFQATVATDVHQHPYTHTHAHTHKALPSPSVRSPAYLNKQPLAVTCVKQIKTLRT